MAFLCDQLNSNHSTADQQSVTVSRDHPLYIDDNNYGMLRANFTHLSVISDTAPVGIRWVSAVLLQKELQEVSESAAIEASLQPRPLLHHVAKENAAVREQRVWKKLGTIEQTLVMRATHWDCVMCLRCICFHTAKH